MDFFIRNITSKSEWEDFLTGCTEKTFLHSWNWGVFQESLGKEIWRMGIFENAAEDAPENLVAVALVVKTNARRGSFLLVPHGPVTNLKTIEKKSAVLKTLTESLRELAKEQKVDFIRINPIWERTFENEKAFANLGYRLRALHTHPESSWKLNIEPSEAKLMDAMRKTTRYLTRQALQSPEIEIYQSFDVADITIFNRMHLEVSKHQKFVPFSYEYLQKEFLAFLPDNQMAFFFAKYQGKVVAASYGIFWSGMAFYHHAALLPEYRRLPVSYLLQWEAIKEAKKRNCMIYDFWGYSDPVKNPKHPYSGPTLFKMGFGGYKEEYVRAQDLVITNRYWINWIIETFRRIRRGL